MSQPFIGPTATPPADPNIPRQPVFTTWCVGWGAYDVPRLHDIVRSEDDELGWEQVKGFRQLAILLLDHYSRLKSHESRLTNAWQGSAADALLGRLDGLAKSLFSDAYCAATTAKALDGIMSTYAGARRRIDGLNTHWYDVTRDWKPEWWDHAAAELNAEAQEVMLKTDQQVAEYRTKIIIPRAAHTALDDELDGESSQDLAHHDDRSRRVPPVPGYQPVLSGLPDANGPTQFGDGLATAPKLVPAVPGQPVSMLPIPPGGPYAPYGGAYILPGPGVGKGGYIVPIPRQGNQAGPMRPGAAASAGGGASMMPTPFPLAQTRNQSGSSPLYRRGNTQWQVEKGGPAVIEGIGADIMIPDMPSTNQQDAFENWFAELAYPWRSNSDSSNTEPQVILRKVRP